MKTLRYAYFFPDQNRINLYYSVNGFNSDRSVLVSTLSPTLQAIVAASLQWALGKLRPGFISVSQVVVEREPDVQIEAEPAPIISAQFTNSITGRNAEAAEDTVLVQSVPNTPGTAAAAQLWNALEQLLNQT